MKITQQDLKRNFKYDATTGYLIKLSTMRHIGKYNGIDYPKAVINGIQYLVHQLVWLYHTGEFPNDIIDHIDRNKQNSHFENLRISSKRNNAINNHDRLNNTSGVCGVSLHKASNKWQVFIKHQNKNKYVGLFANFDDAVKARYIEELKIKYHHINNNSSAKRYLQKNNLLKDVLSKATLDYKTKYDKVKKQVMFAKEHYELILTALDKLTY